MSSNKLLSLNIHILAWEVISVLKLDAEEKPQKSALTSTAFTSKMTEVIGSSDGSICIVGNSKLLKTATRIASSVKNKNEIEDELIDARCIPEK